MYRSFGQQGAGGTTQPHKLPQHVISNVFLRNLAVLIFLVMLFIRRYVSLDRTTTHCIVCVLP